MLCSATLLPTGPAVSFIFVGGFFYLVSALTRLAHYNVTHETVRGFVGIPVPLAALIWSSTLVFTSRPIALGLVLLGCATAMIAPLRIPRPAGRGLVAFVLWPVVVAAGHVVLKRL